MAHDLSGINDRRPLTVEHLPSGEPGVADTIIVLPNGEAPRPVALELPGNVQGHRPDREIEAVRFRDQEVLPKWLRQRPNLPTDPKPSKPEHSDPKFCTARIKMVTPDTQTARGANVEKRVHPEMLGDYLRAGWNLA